MQINYARYLGLVEQTGPWQNRIRLIVLLLKKRQFGVFFTLPYLDLDKKLIESFPIYQTHLQAAS